MHADPLFIDPYAAILLSHDVAHHDMDYLDSHAVPWQDHYRLTTRYIDDKIQNLINNSEDIRQVNLINSFLPTV
jgi:O-methyltransferase involved in polyketide biosynthesis